MDNHSQFQHEAVLDESWKQEFGKKYGFIGNKFTEREMWIIDNVVEPLQKLKLTQHEAETVYVQTDYMPEDKQQR